MGSENIATPLDGLTSSVNERTIEAFKLLSNDTRLAILLALWDAQEPGTYEPQTAEAALAFSELYDRVDVRDSGNFTYHLDKLVGLFVRETDDGYALTTAAEQILAAVFAGTLADPPSFTDEPIDGACYRCGGEMVIDYTDGFLTERCTDCAGIWPGDDDRTGVVSRAYCPPVGLIDRTPQEFHRHTNIWIRHQRTSMLEGVCPRCSGHVATRYHVCEDHDDGDRTVCEHCGSVYEIRASFTCEVCKFDWLTPAFAPIFTATAVETFFYDHGLDYEALFDASAAKTYRDAVVDVDLSERDPVALDVTVELDGDRLYVVLDDEGQVADVTVTPS